MAPLSSLLLLFSLTAIVATREVTTTDGDRISHLEDVIKTLIEMQEKERQVNALQNNRIRNLEETMARYEEENTKLKTENEDLKIKLNKMEISFGEMDARVKRLQWKNLSLIKTVKSNAKIMNNIQFRILHCSKERLESSMQPEKSISVENEESEESFISTESKGESESLAPSRKRLLTGIPTTQLNGVAFSVYLKTHETPLAVHQTILFEGILSNIGNHYNPHTGAFTAPVHGVYVFTWNLYCRVDEGRIFSEIAVNSNAIASMFTSSQGATGIRTTTGIVVAEVNKGDIVLVRTHPSNSHYGSLYSDPAWRSTFSGWLLF
ncbi:uncharacterized protein LOC134278150 [Saccostrea cucullata]|uniref:uncharacterized protein LOC134278150 n=1 Tax=Saccostrea cuccullata TaxID=36930 RepID=UPI002ED64157